MSQCLLQGRWYPAALKRWSIRRLWFIQWEHLGLPTGTFQAQPVFVVVNKQIEADNESDQEKRREKIATSLKKKLFCAQNSRMPKMTLNKPTVQIKI